MNRTPIACDKRRTDVRCQQGVLTPHAHKVVLLQYEYAIESNGEEAPLHRGSTDTLFWSGVAWWLRFSKAASTTWLATAAMLPQLELWRQGA